MARQERNRRQDRQEALVMNNGRERILVKKSAAA